MNGFGTALLSLTTYHPSGTLSAAVDFFFFSLREILRREIRRATDELKENSISFQFFFFCNEIRY